MDDTCNRLNLDNSNLFCKRLESWVDDALSCSAIHFWCLHGSVRLWSHARVDTLQVSNLQVEVWSTFWIHCNYSPYKVLSYWQGCMTTFSIEWVESITGDGRDTPTMPYFLAIKRMRLYPHKNENLHLTAECAYQRGALYMNERAYGHFITTPLNIGRCQIACSYCIGSKSEMVYTSDDFIWTSLPGFHPYEKYCLFGLMLFILWELLETPLSWSVIEMVWGDKVLARLTPWFKGRFTLKPWVQQRHSSHEVVWCKDRCVGTMRKRMNAVMAGLGQSTGMRLYAKCTW